MNCYRHPEREGTLYCQKDMNYMCRECASCHSPRIYCQYRSACVIDLLDKEGELSRCGEQATSANGPAQMKKSSRTG